MITVITIGGSDYDCKTCNEEYGWSQVICESCKGSGAGANGHVFRCLTYIFDDTISFKTEVNEYLKCKVCKFGKRLKSSPTTTNILT